MRLPLEQPDALSGSEALKAIRRLESLHASPSPPFENILGTLPVAHATLG